MAHEEEEELRYLRFAIPPKKVKGVPVITYHDKTIWFEDVNGQITFLHVATPNFTIFNDRYFSAN